MPDISIKDTYKAELDTFLGIFQEGHPEKKGASNARLTRLSGCGQE